MIVDIAELSQASRPWTGQTSQREATERRPQPGDTPMREEPDELPIVFVSRPPLIPRVFPGL
jgi:hypothetical protein